MSLPTNPTNSFDGLRREIDGAGTRDEERLMVFGDFDQRHGETELQFRSYFVVKAHTTPRAGLI